MICPACGHDDDRVKDSRPHDAGVRRKRHCNACKHRWSTIEVAVQYKGMTVIMQEHGYIDVLDGGRIGMPKWIAFLAKRFPVVT